MEIQTRCYRTQPFTAVVNVSEVVLLERLFQDGQNLQLDHVQHVILLWTELTQYVVSHPKKGRNVPLCV